MYIYVLLHELLFIFLFMWSFWDCGILV